MNRAQVLAKVSIFSLMATEDLARLAKRTVYHRYGQGEVIIREGEPGRRLFILVSGQVEVIKNWGSRKERRLRTLGPFSYFGEMALIDDLVRSASVVALEDTQTLSLDQRNLRREIENSPALATALLRMLSKRIRAIEMSMIRSLGDFLPICSMCKRIREEGNLWKPMEEYIQDHYEAEFSHSICPDCSRKLYPEFQPGH